MNALIGILLVTPMPSQGTVLFALTFGLIIGAFVSSTEIGTAYVARKLRINERETPLKYFGLFVVVGEAIATLFFIAIQTLGPSREQTGARSDRAIEELGIALYFGLRLLGVIAATIPVRLLTNRIASK